MFNELINEKLQDEIKKIEDINHNGLINKMINEKMNIYVNEINELKISNEILDKRLEENNILSYKVINSLKKELEEKSIFLLMKISMIKT